jgi:hypothetical protein
MLRRAAVIVGLAAVTVVLNPTARADDATETTYSNYHRAIRAYELCEDRSFDQAEHEKMSIYIDQQIADSLSVGRRLTLIESAKADARDLVSRYGCDSERVQESLSLFSSELQPALMQ